MQDKLEEKKKDVILINRMCTGTYTINNIGHEIINYFKASDGNVYIYILPYGSMNEKYDDRIKTILLTSVLSNHRIEIIAKIDNPQQEIKFKEVKGKKLEKIHEQQVQKYKNIYYGGKTLEQIFKNNYNNQKAIHITFKTDPKNMKKPKDGKHIYITDSKEFTDDDNCIYIKIGNDGKTLASSSLKQYFDEERKADKKDYDMICNCLKKVEWEDFQPEEIPENFTRDDENINFLQLIEKVDEEQVYTNMIWYWFSRKGIFNKFLNYINSNNLTDDYDLLKEKVIPGGRTDILALGNNNIIIIENKIMSGINGIEKDKKGNIIKTQLSKYIEGIEKKQEEKKLLFDKKETDNRIIRGFIFIPDYREFDFLNEIKKCNELDILYKYYKVIKYSELYDFFNKDEIRKIMSYDLYGKKYYLDFLRAIELQKQSNISDKNKIEMKRKFMYAIEQANYN